MDAQNLFTFALENGRTIFPVLFALMLGLALLLRRRPSRLARVAFWPIALAAVLAASAFAFAHRALAAIDERTHTLTFHRIDATAPEQKGPAEKVADHHGKVVILNYWATWCPPCRAEMPDLNKLATTYADRGLVVLTVSDEKVEAIEKYRASNPLDTVVATFTDTPPTDTIGKFAYAGRPTTVIVGRDGKVRRLFIGARSFEAFEAAVQPLL